MAYKRGRSEARSPNYAAGVDDGERDNDILASCPPGDPIGPTPPDPSYPTMYLRGYGDSFTGIVHSCRQCNGEEEAEPVQ